MTSGFYLAAIIGAILSFLMGCLWYSLVVGKVWQKEMELSDDKIKKIFVPKKMIAAFLSQWFSAFCMIGILSNMQLPILYKGLMIAGVLVAQGVQLAIFDGKNIKVILINEGYRLINVLILVITYTIFMT